MYYNFYFETNEESGYYIYKNNILRKDNSVETPITIYDNYQMIRLDITAGYKLAEESFTSNNFNFCEYNQISGSVDINQSNNICICKYFNYYNYNLNNYN